MSLRCGRGQTVQGGGVEEGLSDVHIEQCQPILQGLQSKSAEDQSDTESAQPPLGKVVRVVLDEGINRDPHAGHEARHDADAQGELPRMLNVMYESTTEQSGERVPNGSNDRSPKLAPGETMVARRSIVQSGAHARERTRRPARL